MPTIASQRGPVQALAWIFSGAELMRVLILGGTTEAAELARLIVGDGRFEAVVSLAGRTSSPKALPIETRVGGFGGVDGLRDWLRDHGTEAIIDATHPYAGNISRNAVAAARQAGLPLASIPRPAWTQTPGDHWIEVPDAASAAAALGARPNRVFLSLGRLDIGAFAAAPQHQYLARSIEPPGDVPLPPDICFIFARGPFDEAAERQLIETERIGVIVSKNSGGSATYAKIAAARALEVPVVMIARPQKPAGDCVGDARGALQWLEARLGHGTAPSRRGV
jgi:precorrin-6A/cobalt-precorrin-6A reductase